jgi:5-enolpyruvylshikimate-3-phosphate synthase
MSFAVAGLVANSGMTIEDSDCINTSFPEFMPKLAQLMH